MKTIQQIIRELDSKELEKAFFCKVASRLDDLKDADDITVGELKEYRSKRFQAFLDRIRELEPVEPSDGKHGILFRTKTIGEYGYSSECTEMIYKEELMEAENLSEVTTYAYEYSPQNEAVTFLVADNKLTQDYLMDVAVDFLYEMSFFGYEEEDQAKEIKELDDRIKEMKEHPERLVTYDSESFFKEFGIPEDEEYPEEQILKHKYYDAVREYCRYCITIELERIRETIKRDQD